MNLLIFGAGGHGRCVKEAAETEGCFDRIEFLDDRDSKAIGKLSDYEKYASEFACAFVAIGNPEVRSIWIERIKSKYILKTIIHPKACVSPSAQIGDGSVIMAGAVIQANAQLGQACIVSANAVVDHDAEIGDYCHINCGAVVPSMSKVPMGTKINYNEVYVPEIV